MSFIIYSLSDPTSVNAAESLKSDLGFEEAAPIEGRRHFISKDMPGVEILEIQELHINAEFLDRIIRTDMIFFLSRHRSAAGVPSFTVHPEGNWSAEAKLGGKPKELSVAAPVAMLNVLKKMSGSSQEGINVTYEATHHGPLLNTPSLYIEVGGNDEIINSKPLASTLAMCLGKAIADADADFNKIAVGVGSTHYPSKFTKLALDGKYAFAHMMPKHFVAEVDMLQQAFDRARPRPEVCVIEWTSVNATERNKVLDKLKELGIEYVRV
jgi:D-aminoacyl-tRNA deacylase